MICPFSSKVFPSNTALCVFVCVCVCVCVLVGQVVLCVVGCVGEGDSSLLKLEDEIMKNTMWYII